MKTRTSGVSRELLSNCGPIALGNISFMTLFHNHEDVRCEIKFEKKQVLNGLTWTREM